MALLWVSRQWFGCPLFATQDKQVVNLKGSMRLWK